MYSKHNKTKKTKSLSVGSIIGLAIFSIVGALAVLFFVDLAIVTRNANHSVAKGDFSIDQETLNNRAKRVKTLEVEQNRKLAGNPIRAKEIERRTMKESKDPPEKPKSRVKVETEKVIKAREQSLSPETKRRMEEAEQRRIAHRHKIRDREKAREPKRERK